MRDRVFLSVYRSCLKKGITICPVVRYVSIIVNMLIENGYYINEIILHKILQKVFFLIIRVLYSLGNFFFIISHQAKKEQI